MINMIKWIHKPKNIIHDYVAAKPKLQITETMCNRAKNFLKVLEQLYDVTIKLQGNLHHQPLEQPPCHYCALSLPQHIPISKGGWTFTGNHNGTSFLIPLLAEIRFRPNYRAW